MKTASLFLSRLQDVSASAEENFLECTLIFFRVQRKKFWSAVEKFFECVPAKGAVLWRVHNKGREETLVHK